VRACKTIWIIDGSHAEQTIWEGEQRLIADHWALEMLRLSRCWGGARLTLYTIATGRKQGLSHLPRPIRGLGFPTSCYEVCHRDFLDLNASEPGGRKKMGPLERIPLWFLQVDKVLEVI
jgi:hypothetical protein